MFEIIPVERYLFANNLITCHPQQETDWHNRFKRL